MAVAVCAIAWLGVLAMSHTKYALSDTEKE